MQPTDNNTRIDTLDYLRGFALLGIILVNIPSLMWIEPPTLASDIAYNRFLTLFIEGKFFIIFSFLFGVGFYLFISRVWLETRKLMPYLAEDFSFYYLWGLSISIFNLVKH